MLYAIVTVIILILDQGLKYWTSLNLELNTGIKELIPGFIHLTNHHNYGAAFGILQNARWFFVVITVIFVVAVAVLISMEIISGTMGKWTAVMVLAGAVGNGIDRALYGYVVDMLEFEFFSFPIFNIADIFITVGGILLCVYIIFQQPDDPAPAEHTPKSGLRLFSRTSEQAESISPEHKVKVVRSQRPAEPVKPRAIDPNNPFAEWEVHTRDTEPVSDETGPLPDIDPEDIAVFTPPVADEIPEEDISAPAAEAEPPASEAPAAEAPGAEAPQVTAPTEAEAPSIPGVDDIPSPDLTEKKAVVVDDEVMEFSLEDILAEFGKDT